MGADQNLDWRELAASALEWWRDAGVDVSVDDTARNWLTPALPERTTVAAAPASRAATLPDTAEAFLAWRSGIEAPETGWHGARVAASGPADAALMILVDCPEKDDRACLMEGAVGRLFDRMLAAIGQSRATVHLAAVTQVRPVAGRIPADTLETLTALARHHVALIAPKRLIVMGDAASRAILATDVRDARGRLQPLNHRSGQVTEAVSTFHPRLLLDRPALKAEAWRALQLAIGGLAW